MPSKAPTVKFNNGLECPVVGLGTWKSKPGQVTQAVKDAIDVGYRHIDCALVYGNEPEVGEAIRAKIEEGVIMREELFIASKLWNTYHKSDIVIPTLKRSLDNLGLAYLDLYLIHWPVAFKEGDVKYPEKDGKVQFSDADYVDTWKALEKAVRQGLVKSIGVSNFNSEQVERILSVAEIKPVTNQIECNPYLNQRKLMEFCKARDILITCYSPLGSGDRPLAKPDDPHLMSDPKLKKMAEKYQKSIAQIALRYQIQRGNIVIPKSVTKSRIMQNIDIFDFCVSQEDMMYIDSLDCGARFCTLYRGKLHKNYPFNIEF